MMPDRTLSTPVPEAKVAWRTACRAWPATPEQAAGDSIHDGQMTNNDDEFIVISLGSSTFRSGPPRPRPLRPTAWPGGALVLRGLC
jgi:hypothetical protein